MQEIRVRSLGQEDPLEKGMATHSSILAWETPWTEEPGRLQSWGRKESDMTEHEHPNQGLGTWPSNPIARPRPPGEKTGPERVTQLLKVPGP